MIYLRNLHKRYGKKVIFEDVNFHLGRNERVGLVGENGVGKTTLLKVIAGQETLDSGTATVSKGLRAAMLRQELESGEETVLERVLKGDGEFKRIHREMETLEKDEAFHRESPEEWSRKYGDLQHEFERLGGYERKAQAKSALSGLGFRPDEFAKPLNQFSGGWRMRVELAQLLLQHPDVLLLDEPTNHLDLGSVVWLESFLKSYEGGLLLISHDRRFLNSLVGRIAELDRGRMYLYKGTYDAFERLKKEREEQLEAQAANQQRRIAEIERFVERFRAKNTKATQAQSRIKMLEKMQRVETATQTKSVHFRFPQPARTGRMVIEVKEAHKSYGPVRVYENFSAHLERGWKVALVGENGAGKSTLLKLLAGILQPGKGEVKLGANVTRAYYSQHHSEILDPEHTVLESLDTVAGHLVRTQKQNILGAFLFSGDDIFKKVSVLSGGERSRLSLARMLAFPHSLLLLDEPTNHLDMRSTEFLAAALADYEGTLCAISHDRFFLDGIIDRVWEIEDGRMREYIGNYSDYEWAKSREAENNLKSATSLDASADNSPAQIEKDRKRKEAEARNLRYKIIKPLQDKLADVEKRLERMMQEKDKAELELADPAIHSEDQKPKLMDVLARQQEMAQEETKLIKRWEELSARIEAAEGGNGFIP